MPCTVVIDRNLERCSSLAATVRTCLSYRPEKWDVEALPSCQEIASFCDIAVVSADDGLKEAERLRDWDRRMALLLVADSEEYTRKGYGLRAVDYLIRPVAPEMLARGLINALFEMDRNRAYIDLPAEGGMRREMVNDILYLEGEGPNSKVCTGGREYRISAPLSALGLPGHFFPCDGRRVNLACVGRIGDRDLSVGDLCIPISRWARRKLIRALPVVIDPFENSGLIVKHCV